MRKFRFFCLLLSLSRGAMKVIFMLIAYDATAALLFPFRAQQTQLDEKGKLRGSEKKTSTKTANYYSLIFILSRGKCFDK